MPLTIPGVQGSIIDAMHAQFGTSLYGEDHLSKMALAIATAIVNQIHANASVNTTVTGTVTSGAGSGGTVTGTGVGSIT